MGPFTRDTEVTRTDDHTYEARVAPGYGVIEGAPNGGYLLVLAARAMAMTADRPDPVSVTAHFLRPPTEDPVAIHTEVHRAGGRHVTVSASIVQDGVTCVRALGTFGDLDRAEGITDVRIPPPDWPAPDQVPLLLDTVAEGGMAPPIFHRLEHRLDPAVWGWARGEPTGDGRMQSWCRLPEGEEMDVMTLLFVADALPPPVFNLGTSVGWVPTIELTVHVRRRPTTDWLAARFRTRAVTDGYLEEDGEIWSQDGDLLAISRQSALAARPR